MKNTERSLPTDHADTQYCHDVLQLEDGLTEAAFDQILAREAENLGITIARPPTPNPKHHISMCESAITVGSHHARTGSTGSEGSNSTGMTSRSSTGDAPTLHAKRCMTRRSLSFSEYEKYVVQTEAPAVAKPGYNIPIPPEPAPSLFSVSTRRSYVSIKNGIKSRFRLRRTRKAVDEDLK